MGTQYTPLLKTPIPDWQEKPDVPKWSMTSLSAAERYAIVPVPDAATRETLLPLAGRWKGQTTYRADGDVFEYWNSTAWVPMNAAVNTPSTVAVASYPSVVLAVGKNYQVMMSIKVSQACQVMLDINANIAFDPTATNYATVYMAPLLDGDIGTWIARNSGGYIPGGVYDTITAQVRYNLAAGTHTLGLNLTKGSGSAAATVAFAKAVATRISNVPNAAAGTGAYGTW